MVVKTPTPGFTAEVYITDGDVPETIEDPAWRRVAPATRIGAKQSIDLDSAGQRARHVLLWITQLPPGGDSVKVSELQLYR